jgi:RNA polymerase sigma factor (sigma-70 family)
MAATDIELVRQYREGSQAAFRELVRRHLNMVFSAARRQTRSPALAEEVTQSVFIKLATDAGRIGERTPLAAWLHLVTRHTAVNAARTESRRQSREQASIEISAMSSSTPGWSNVEPLLDAAVASLRTVDRTAIVLRFFEGKSLREVGEALGSTEEAARKRVGRALEQLRALLLKRGVTVSSSALAADLTTHAIQIAPLNLSTTLLSGVSLPVGALPPAMVGAASTLAMTTMQKSLLVATAVIAGGFSLYQTRTISRQSDDLAQLRKNYAALAARQTSGAAPLAASTQSAADAPRPTNPISGDGATAADRKVIATMGDWVDRATRLRDLLKSAPMWVIPEFRALKEIDWLDDAKDATFETEADIQNAFSKARTAANQRVAALVRAGLKAHASAHSGMMPTSVEELAPYFDSAVDPAMQLNPAHGASLHPETKQVILKRALEWEWFERTFSRGTIPASAPVADAAPRKEGVSDSLAAFNHALMQLQQTHGRPPSTETQMTPFLPTSMNAVLRKTLFDASQGSVLGK